MQQPVPRCLLGGALAASILSGCDSRGPLTIDPPAAPPGAAPVTAPPRRADVSDERGGTAALPTLDAEATLDDYLRYAALNNAGLEAMFQEWQAALQRVPQEKALPDPRVTYGYYFGEVETRVGPMRHSVALSQTFPWFGKLQDREDAAARRANAAHARFEAARLDLFFRVEEAYNELFFLQRSIAITGDNIELLRQFERVVRTRYRVAAAGHPDVIRIQIELGALEDRLRKLHALREPTAARLNAALSRAADAPVAWPRSIAERVADVAPDALYTALLERNPQLAALQEEIERERLGSAIARKDGLPDFTVALAYTIIDERSDVRIPENGDDAVLASLSINVPLWRDKYDAAVREALARRLAAASRRDDATHALARDLRQAVFEHEDARRRVALYGETLIPKSEESLQAFLARFEQGEADFLDLIETQRTLLEFQLARARALADRATSYAHIERLVGVPLVDLDAVGAAAEVTP